MNRARATLLVVVAGLMGVVAGAWITDRVWSRRALELTAGSAAADAQVSMYLLDRVLAGDSKAAAESLEMRLEGARATLARCLSDDESLATRNPALVKVLDKATDHRRRFHRSASPVAGTGKDVEVTPGVLR